MCAWVGHTTRAVAALLKRLVVPIFILRVYDYTSVQAREYVESSVMGQKAVLISNYRVSCNTRQDNPEILYDVVLHIFMRLHVMPHFGITELTGSFEIQILYR